MTEYYYVISGCLTTKDTKVVLKVLWSTRSKWFNVGIELGMDTTDLDAIKMNNNRDVDQCFTDMIIKWLQQEKSLSNWNSILSALRSPTVGREDLADDIEADSWEDGPSKHFKCIEEVQDLDDDNKEKLEEAFIQESERIRLKFQAFCGRFCDSLEQRQIPIKRLVYHLKGLQQVRKSALKKSIIPNRKYEETVEDFKNYDDVKGIIEEYSTFIDYWPVEYMIDAVGTDKDKEELLEYKKLFEQYIRRRTYKCPCELGPTSHRNHTNLLVKVESDYDKLCMVEVKQIQTRLSLILDVAAYTLRVSSIEEGCIRLIFRIPKFIQEAIFPLSSEQEAALVELGVIQLSCGDYHFPRSQVILLMTL